MKRIAGVVVTYNRKLELKKNIDIVLSQTKIIDAYYIIDNNSTDGTYDYLLSEGVIDNNIIKYIKLTENIGGAGGFYTGVKTAYEEGFDFIILMDDDGRPLNHDTIENLYNKAIEIHSNNKNEILLNSLVIFKDGVLSFGLGKGILSEESAYNCAINNEIIDKINPFNGTLISKELIAKIGFPNQNFFIKGDEVDYFNRALNSKAYIATVTNSLYFHPKVASNRRRFLFKKFNSCCEIYWKEYYTTRNYTYMYYSDSSKNIIKKYMYSRKFLCKRIINALYTKGDKRRTIKYILKGFKDGKKGRLGPTIRP